MQETFAQSSRVSRHADSDSRCAFPLAQKLKQYTDKQAALARDQIEMSHEQLRFTHLMLEYIDVAQHCAPTPVSPPPPTTTTDDGDSSSEDAQRALLAKIRFLYGDINRLHAHHASDLDDLRAKHARELSRATTSRVFLFFVFLLGFFAGVVHRDRSL